MTDKIHFQLAEGAPAIYEKVLVPVMFERWAKALIALVELRPGETVLDVACGTGVTTRLANDAVGEDGHVTGLDINAPMLSNVTGLDINAPMLSIARELATGSNIVWVERDVSETGLDPSSFDVVLSQHGYHYFPDKPRALSELRRVLVPGGRLALSIWDDHSAYTSALCVAIEKYISPEIAKQQSGMRMTPNPEQLIAALTDAGFKNVEAHTQTLEIRAPSTREFVPLHLASMPIAGAFDALGMAEKQKLIDHVASALSGYEQDGQLVYPDTVNVVVGYR
jgi:ubiquinone/menaquinone biosynthesis C-methylase UbiE